MNCAADRTGLHKKMGFAYFHMPVHYQSIAEWTRLQKGRVWYENASCPVEGRREEGPNREKTNISNRLFDQ